MRVIVHSYGDVLARTGKRTRVIPITPVTTLAQVALDVATERWGGKTKLERVTVVHNGTPVVKLEKSRLWQPLADGDVVMVGPGAPQDPGTIVAIVIAIATTALSALLTTKVRLPASENPTDTNRLGFSRESHAAVSGDPIQVCVGRIARCGPKLIADVPVDGPDGDARRRLLFSFGRGAINAIGSFTAAADWVDVKTGGPGGGNVTGIYFNDQPIVNYPGTLISVRLGQPSQRAIAGFKDTEVLHDVGGAGGQGFLLANTSGADRTGAGASGEAVIYSTVDAVDALRLLVRFPTGLYTLSSSGQTGTRSVQFRYRTRTSDIGAGAGAWSGWTVKGVSRSDQQPVVVSIRLDDLTPGNPPAKFDVQVERVTAQSSDATIADQMNLDQVVEVVYSSNHFNDLAMLAIEIAVSEQLTSVPDVTSSVEGLKTLRLWDGVSDPDSPTFTVGWSQNPADVALAMITDTTWGMGTQGYTDSDVDFASLLDWRTKCAEAVPLVAAGGGTRPRFAYNNVLQNAANGVDQLRAVCSVGRCTPVRVGRKWVFIFERRQGTPVEQFGEGDLAMTDGKPACSWARAYTYGGESVPNRITLQFANEQAAARTDTVSWPPLGTLWFDPALPGGAEPVNEQSIKLDGVTHPEQAIAECRYRCRKLRYQSRTEKRTTTKAIVAVQPGDRYDAAALVANYSLASGRLGVGNTVGMVALDRSIVLEDGKTYTIQVQHADGSVEPRTISSTPGAYQAGTPIGVSLDFSQAPGDYAGYSLGELGRAVKPYLATAVRPNVDATTGAVSYDVEGVEYVDGLYDDVGDLVDLPDYSSNPNSRTPPGPVVDLTVRETVVNGVRTVTVGWRQNPADAVNTAYFRVYRRDAGSQTPIAVPSVSGTKRAAVIELADLGRAYQFTAIAVSAGGSALSPYDDRVPWAGVVYGNFQPPPAAPSNAVLTLVGGNVFDLTWDPPAADDTGENTVVGYQVLWGGDSGTGRPNDGAEDCLVLARTVLPELRGLALAPGTDNRFWVRSVNGAGRLSIASAEVAVAGGDVAAPPTRTVLATFTPDLSASGALTNAAWNGGASRVRMTDPDTEAAWESDAQDAGAAGLAEINGRTRTANDQLTGSDVTLAGHPFVLPSIAADQWAVGGLMDGSKTIVMTNPPYPDDEQAWTVEVSTSIDGVTYQDWIELAPCGRITVVMRYYKVRVRMRRKTAGGPYRPALRGISVVVSQ